MIDFATVNSAALARLPDLLHAWLPGGNNGSGEYTVRNPTRDDATPGSFSINIKTGTWADFATGDKGGDPISLYAYLNRLGQGAACRAVAALVGAAEGQAKKVEYVKIVCPIPDGAPPIPDSVCVNESGKWNRYPASLTHIYRTSLGGTQFAVLRYEHPTRGKQIVPFTLWTCADGRMRWRQKGLSEPRPLYNLDRLAHAPVAAVVLVEGEKCADALQGIVDGAGNQAALVVSTWSGGARALKKTDFAPLARRNVILWPDNDSPGREAMEVVGKKLRGFGCTVKVIEVPADKPESWDCADAVLTDRWGMPEILDFIRRNSRLSTATAEVPATPKTVPAVPLTVTIPNEKFYYHRYAKEYVLRNSRGCWLNLTESQFRKELARRGKSTYKDDGVLSEIDRTIMQIRDTADIDYCGALAGYHEGFYEVNSVRILVTTSPRIIEPVAGLWPTIKNVIDNLLVGDMEIQRQVFFGWLKIAYESLKAGYVRPGQVVAFCGEKDSGKSLLQSLITIVLGGRSVKPFRYLSGGSEFNYDLFGSEHLCIEDEPSTTDLRTRRAFGSKIKQVAAADTQSCHQKHRDALTLSPFWRCTISLNLEPENLLVLPPIDEDVCDKMILFRTYKKTMPMLTCTNEQRKTFYTTLCAEMPAFIHHLTEYRIPDNLKSERYGVTHYHHHEIIESLDDLAPETKLLSLIDATLFIGDGFNPTPTQWTGSATELENILCSSGNYVHEARRLLNWQNATGSYLGRLRIKYPERFSRDRTADSRKWTIYTKGMTP